MSRGPVAVLRDGLAAHPAVQAWRRVAGEAAPVLRVEVLRRPGRTAVYRLVGAGPARGGVVVKRLPPGPGASEPVVYERILPHLAQSAPRCYGTQLTDDGWWIFLEDVGSVRYVEGDPVQLAIVTRWVATMHHTAAGLAAAKELPDAGAARYLRLLQRARGAMQRRRGSGDLSRADTALLDRVTERYDALERRWEHVERACVGLPATLVHGDFRPKNVYLRGRGETLACFPIDWETAGWGVPAADLTRIDTAVYWTVTRRWRPVLALATVRRLTVAGHLFQALAAIDWEAGGLDHDAPAIVRQLASLRVLENRLVGASHLMGLAS
jgi:aminoglycoside phosphotransferase (APT) family kinase protein